MKNYLKSGKGKFFFQKFTRKKFSVFKTLGKVVHISNLAMAYTLIAAPTCSIAQGDSTTIQQVYDLDELEVIGQLATTDILEMPRIIAVVNTNDISHSPSQSVTDILTYSANVDVRQRGKSGIQSDISFRGSSFDHNLILLNGINISDPQTGHLSLNLPVESDALNHIELLNGPAARVHGANAIAGAINFITKPNSVNSIFLSSKYGNFGYMSNSATINIISKNTRNLVHYNNAFSDGYARNTDFKRHSVFYHSEITTNEGVLGVQLGYSDRSFGSNGFYTPRFPDQYEQNQMSFASVGYKTGKNITLHPRVYWRRHRDRWEMFRVGPDWYKVENNQSISNNTFNTTFDTIFIFTNHHINDVMGINTTLSAKSIFGTSTLGFHIRTENIISNNIGNELDARIPVRGYSNTYYTLSDNRSGFDFHFEQKYNTKQLNIALGAMLNWNTYRPEQIHIFPGVDIRYNLISNYYIHGSYNYTVGYPTFTDLNYHDPNNSGNNKLEPYTLHSYEGGIRWFTGTGSVNLSYFRMTGSDVIDWVWISDLNKFQPVNISQYLTEGMESSLILNTEDVPLLNILFNKVRLNYTFIDMVKDLRGNYSKYSNIRNKFSAMLSRTIYNNITAGINLNYTERNGSYQGYDFINNTYVQHSFSPYFLIDAQISYTLKAFTFSIEATNVLNTKYIDIGSIYQPGRWITGGVKYTLTGF